MKVERHTNELSVRVHLYDALSTLLACFNDEGKLEERWQDQVSVALEEAQKAIKSADKFAAREG